MATTEDIRDERTSHDNVNKTSIFCHWNYLLLPKWTVARTQKCDVHSCWRCGIATGIKTLAWLNYKIEIILSAWKSWRADQSVVIDTLPWLGRTMLLITFTNDEHIFLLPQKVYSLFLSRVARNPKMIDGYALFFFLNCSIFNQLLVEINDYTLVLHSEGPNGVVVAILVGCVWLAVRVYECA